MSKVHTAEKLAATATEVVEVVAEELEADVPKTAGPFDKSQAKEEVKVPAIEEADAAMESPAAKASKQHTQACVAQPKGEVPPASVESLAPNKPAAKVLAIDEANVAMESPAAKASKQHTQACVAQPTKGEAPPPSVESLAPNKPAAKVPAIEEAKAVMESPAAKASKQHTQACVAQPKGELLPAEALLPGEVRKEIALTRVLSNDGAIATMEVPAAKVLKGEKPTQPGEDIKLTMTMSEEARTEEKIVVEAQSVEEVYAAVAAPATEVEKEKQIVDEAQLKETPSPAHAIAARKAPQKDKPPSKVSAIEHANVAAETQAPAAEAPNEEKPDDDVQPEEKSRPTEVLSPRELRKEGNLAAETPAIEEANAAAKAPVPDALKENLFDEGQPERDAKPAGTLEEHKVAAVEPVNEDVKVPPEAPKSKAVRNVQTSSAPLARNESPLIWTLHTATGLKHMMCAQIIGGCRKRHARKRARSVASGPDEIQREAARKSPQLRRSTQIFVKPITGKTITLNIAPSDTILNVKKILEGRLSVPSCHQRLIFRGKQLQNAYTASHYAIRKSSTLHMVTRLCAGMQAQAGDILPDDTVQWMWGDAGVVHTIAQKNPFRWSHWHQLESTITDLVKCTNDARPVEIITKRRPSDIIEFATVDQALSELRKQVAAALPNQKTGDLRRKALLAGVTQEEVDDVLEKPDRRKTLIELITKKQATLAKVPASERTGFVQNEDQRYTEVVLWALEKERKERKVQAKMRNGDKVTVMSEIARDYKVRWNDQEGLVEQDHIQATLAKVPASERTGFVQNEDQRYTEVVLWALEKEGKERKVLAKMRNGDKVTVMSEIARDYKVRWNDQEGSVKQHHIQATSVIRACSGCQRPGATIADHRGKIRNFTHCCKKCEITQGRSHTSQCDADNKVRTDKEDNKGKIHTYDDAIERMLRKKQVALARPTYFIDLFFDSEDTLTRRQDLNETFFVDMLALRKEMFDEAIFICISYCWLQKRHPDPNRYHLELLARCLRSFSKGSITTAKQDYKYDQHEASREYFQQEGWHFGGADGATVGVFMDFVSLYQVERTTEENKLFQQALDTMHAWYAHQRTLTWIFENTPAETERSYGERGWPTFERSVSELITPSHSSLVFDQKMRDRILSASSPYHTGDYMQLALDAIPLTRCPPKLPKTFNTEIEKKIFTSKRSDCMKHVKPLYERSFTELIEEATELCFPRVAWQDAQADELMHVVQDQCKVLHHLDLSGNAFTKPIDHWAQFLKSTCKSLKLEGNPNMAGDIRIFSDYTDLKALYLGRTGVTGDISCFEGLSVLETLKLYTTEVTGDISCLGKLKNMQILDLSETKVKGELKKLTTMLSMQELDLSDAAVKGDLKDLSTFSNMKKLRLRKCKDLTGNIDDLKDLWGMEHLSLENTPVEGDISSLKTIEGMEYLDLSDTSVTGDIATLAFESPDDTSETGDSHSFKALATMEHLNLSGTKVTGELSDIKTCVGMKHLILKKTDITGDIASLGSLTNMKSLELNSTKVKGDIKEISTLTNLSKLDFSSTADITGDIASLGSLKNMKSLELNSTQVKGDIKEISTLTNLSKLDFSSTDVTGDIAGVKDMAGMKDLRLENTHVEGNISSLKPLANMKLLKIPEKVKRDEVSRRLEEAMEEEAEKRLEEAMEGAKPAETEAMEGAKPADTEKLPNFEPNEEVKVYCGSRKRWLASIIVEILPHDSVHVDCGTFRRIIPRSQFTSDTIRKVAKIWNADTVECAPSFIGHTDKVRSAKFSADCSLVLTASRDRTAQVWKVDTGECTQRFTEQHTREVISAVFSPDGWSVLTAANDGTVKIWDAATGVCRHTLAGHKREGVISAVFSRDGTSVLTASIGYDAKTWSAGTGVCRQTFHGHKSDVRTAEFSPNGKSVLTASVDREAKLWNAETGECSQTFRGHTGYVVCALFSPDGLSVLTGSYDHTAKIWNADTGACRHTFSGHTSDVTSAVFSLDGLSVLTASMDHTAMIWDAGSGTCRRTLKGHTSDVMSAVFSLDGSFIITASKDCTAKIWVAATGVCRHTLAGHEREGVISAVFSPDGSAVVTVSGDTAKIWQASDSSCLLPVSGDGKANARKQTLVSL